MTDEIRVSQGALDLRLGMQALDRELITPDQLKEAMAEQAREAAGGGKPRELAAILVARGFMTEAAKAELLGPPKADPKTLHRQDLRLRDLLLKEGVPLDHLDQCAMLQAQALASGGESPRLADLMVDLGFATPEVISSMLAVQKRAALFCPACRKRYNVKNYYPLREYRCFHCKGLLETTGEEWRATGMEMPVVAAEIPADLPPLGKFKLVREIGKGGMGIVYEALDTQLNRKVAVKLMLTSPHAEPDEVKLDEERFIREARLSAKLSHPNIVTVFEAGIAGGRRYIAMEFIEGVSFAEWRRQGSVTIRQQVSFLRDVALALHTAHGVGVLHRDVKPGNILVDGRNQPKVMDFGLGKVAGTHTSISLTLSGAIIGTPAYMSPEQSRGVKTIDGRTDVWSLGVMLYETIAGRLPFEGENTLDTLMRVMKDEVVPPSKKVAGPVDPVLESVCMKALTKPVEERYATAESFARDLARWLKGEDFRVPSAPAPARARPRPRKC